MDKITRGSYLNQVVYDSGFVGGVADSMHRRGFYVSSQPYKLHNPAIVINPAKAMQNVHHRPVVTAVPMVTTVIDQTKTVALPPQQPIVTQQTAMNAVKSTEKSDMPVASGRRAKSPFSGNRNIGNGRGYSGGKGFNPRVSGGVRSSATFYSPPPRHSNSKSYVKRHYERQVLEKSEIEQFQQKMEKEGANNQFHTPTKNTTRKSYQSKSPTFNQSENFLTDAWMMSESPIMKTTPRKFQTPIGCNRMKNSDTGNSSVSNDENTRRNLNSPNTASMRTLRTAVNREGLTKTLSAYFPGGCLPYLNDSKELDMKKLGKKITNTRPKANYPIRRRGEAAASSDNTTSVVKNENISKEFISNSNQKGENGTLGKKCLFAARECKDSLQEKTFAEKMSRLSAGKSVFPNAREQRTGLGKKAEESVKEDTMKNSTSNNKCTNEGRTNEGRTNDGRMNDGRNHLATLSSPQMDLALNHEKTALLKPEREFIFGKTVAKSYGKRKVDQCKGMILEPPTLLKENENTTTTLFKEKEKENTTTLFKEKENVQPSMLKNTPIVSKGDFYAHAVESGPVVIRGVMRLGAGIGSGSYNPERPILLPKYGATESVSRFRPRFRTFRTLQQTAPANLPAVA